jgi:hypothetical protein
MRPSFARRRIVARVARWVLALSAAAAFWPAPAVAEKTDLVVLLNGDRLTGEIKGMAHGKLDYSTDDAGRISIEWDKVASVMSPQYFQVELGSGIRYFGQLAPADRDGFLVVRSARADTLLTWAVVEISQISAGFLQRLQSYLDVGLTVAKANQATTFSLSGMAEYRGPHLGTQLKVDSYVQGQESVPTTTRNSARQSFSWYLPDRWSVVGIFQAEQNDELDLDHRYSGGGGMSRVLHQTNQMELSTGAGLVVTEEKFSSETGATSETSIEGLLAADWSAFRFDSPKLDFRSGLALFPSLSQGGRVRGQLEFRFKYEIFKDFLAGILFTDTFDTQPPDENASKNDYVTTLTIGWSYRR